MLVPTILRVCAHVCRTSHSWRTEFLVRGESHVRRISRSWRAVMCVRARDIWCLSVGRCISAHGGQRRWIRVCLTYLRNEMFWTLFRKRVVLTIDNEPRYICVMVGHCRFSRSNNKSKTLLPRGACLQRIVIKRMNSRTVFYELVVQWHWRRRRTPSWAPENETPI